MKVSVKLLLLTLIISMSGCSWMDHEIPVERVRLVKQIIPDYGTYMYSYDASGRMAKETFAPSVSITPYYFDFTSFDATNRLLEGVANFAPPIPDLAHEVQRNPDGSINRIRKYCADGSTCTSGIWYFAYPMPNTVEVAFWDNGSIYGRKDVYTFNALGQITEEKYYNASNVLVTTTSYTNFDDKWSKTDHYPEGYFTSPNGKNNVLTSELTVHATGVITNHVYNYEYTTQGFITKSYRDGTLTATFQYESY